MTTIKDLWKDYKKAAVPSAASHTQVIQTEQAFYAGVHCAVAALFNDNDSVEVMSETLLQFQTEIKEYSQLRTTMDMRADDGDHKAAQRRGLQQLTTGESNDRK